MAVVGAWTTGDGTQERRWWKRRLLSRQAEVYLSS